jgi:hypothetical protein
MDVTVDLPGLTAGEQILSGDRPEARRVELDRLVTAGNLEPPSQFPVPGHEGRNVGVTRRPADTVSDVDREKVARIEKAVDRLEPDVVGVDEQGWGQRRAATAAAAASRTLAGSLPMKLCSRFDLFQTGATTTPSAASFSNAANWASA